MAYEDKTLYRVITDQPSSSACVTAAECDDTAISAFGDRTCIFNESISLKWLYSCVYIASYIEKHQFEIFKMLWFPCM